MALVTINSGSTSVKLGLFERERGGGLTKARAELHSSRHEDAHAALAALTRDRHDAVTAIAHRVVHGGELFAGPTVLDPSVVMVIEGLSALAPLHNPQALRWIRAASDLWPAIPQVALFDTALFRNLPRVAAEYALPPDLGTDLGIKRYGFHGLAHEAMLKEWSALHPELEQGGRLITVQLGGGCSITAFNCGRAMDTSMGFSPLEGLIMATRSGDIDPAIVPYLQKQLGISGEQVVQRLNEDCGLAGVAGSAANPAVLLRDRSPQAQFAVELYCYRIRKFIGAYLAVLGGCDGIAFGGGIGEHVPGIRARALQGLEWAGVRIDPQRNDLADGGNALLSAADSRIKVHVIAVDEESALARAAAALA